MVIKLELSMYNVQILRIITTGFWFDIKEQERKKTKYATTSLISANKRFRNGIINTGIILKCIPKADYTIVINGKTKKYYLSTVIKLELYDIVLHKHKKQLNLLIFKVIINYDLKVLKEN